MFITARSIFLLICISRSYSAMIESLTIWLTFISRIFSNKSPRPKFTNSSALSGAVSIVMGNLKISELVSERLHRKFHFLQHFKMITKHGIDFIRIQHKGLFVQHFHGDHCFCKVKNSLSLTRLFISR